MFAPVAPLIACLKLQCSEVHVFLMCVMLRLRSCDCPEVKEGSWGRMQWWISWFAVLLLLPALQTQLPLYVSSCAQPNLVPSCQHTKTWPQSHAVKGWDQCGWPRYTVPPPLCDWTQFACGSTTVLERREGKLQFRPELTPKCCPSCD